MASQTGKKTNFANKVCDMRRVNTVEFVSV